MQPEKNPVKNARICSVVASNLELRLVHLLSDGAMSRTARHRYNNVKTVDMPARDVCNQTKQMQLIILETDNEISAQVTDFYYESEHGSCSASRLHESRK